MLSDDIYMPSRLRELAEELLKHGNDPDIVTGVVLAKVLNTVAYVLERPPQPHRCPCQIGMNHLLEARNRVARG